jgi:hypothetical protein
MASSTRAGEAVELFFRREDAERVVRDWAGGFEFEGSVN